MLLEEETECFAFLARSRIFAGCRRCDRYCRKSKQSKKTAFKSYLNGLGKDAAQVISRINGFTYVETDMDYYTGEVKYTENHTLKDFVLKLTATVQMT